MNAVFISWMFAFIAFLAKEPTIDGDRAIRAASSLTLGRLSNVASSCMLIVYALNCFTYLLFFRE